MQTRISRRCRPRAPSSRSFDSALGIRVPTAVSPAFGLVDRSIHHDTKGTEDTEEPRFCLGTRINQNPGAMTALGPKEVNRQVGVSLPSQFHAEWPCEPAQA